MRYVLLLVTIAIMAIGQILFKLSASYAQETPWAFLLRPTFIGALGLYAIGTLAWIFTLRMWPLSIAYPSQALTIVIVTTIGLTAFGETVTPIQLAGLVVILLGVGLLAVGTP